MSYLVLARKYRPRNFREMVGQPHVVTALGNALAQKRLHHAYLFTGTRGVGKTTVSRILAKSLNCVGPDGRGDITAEPCGVCEACRAIDVGNFVDYTELDAASNRGVDEVQQLLEQAVYKPVQGRFKVFMIDEVHMLTNTAFNAMLKTLEEPPEYLKFVLATTDPQKVPVTVLSRCLQFNLRPMAPETVREHLQTVLGNEQIAAEPGALTLLSRAARGSMRDALSLTDQAIAFGAGQVDESTVRQMLGAVDRQQVFALIEALARGDGRAVVTLVDQARAVGLNAGSLLEDMAQVLQHMAVIQAAGLAEAPGDADPDQRMEHQLAQQMARDETQLLYSICIHGRAELGLAPDEYAGLTMVLLRLLAFKPAPAQGEAEKKTPDSGPVTEAPAAARATPVAQQQAPAVAMPPASAPVPSAGIEQPSMKNGSMGVSPLTDERERIDTPEFIRIDTPLVALAPDEQVVAAPHTAPVTKRQQAIEPASAWRDPAPQAAGATAAPAIHPAERVAPAAQPRPDVAPSPAPAKPQPEATRLRPEQACEIDEHTAPAARPEPDMAPEPMFFGDEDEDLGPAPLPPWEELAELDAPPLDTRPAMPMGAAPAAPARGALQPLPVRAVPDEAAAPPFDAVDPQTHPVVSVPLARASRDEAPAGQSKPLPPLVPTAEGEFWHGLVTQLVRDEAINGFVRELALQSQLLRRDAVSWHLACTSGLLGSAGTVERLQGALAEAGHAVKLQVDLADVSDTPSLRNQHAQARKLLAARALLEADPFVQALQRDFAAKIVDHSVKPL